MMKKTADSTALALLLGLGLALPAAAQEGADMDADQYVTAVEAQAYDERRWREFTGGAEEMRIEHFTSAMSGAQDYQASFAEADVDQNGRVSRDEWIQWREGRFTEATEGTEGRMEAGQYEIFERGGEAQ